MSFADVIAHFATGEYTVLRTARGVLINGKYILPQPWAPATAYILDQLITNGGNTYEATTPGTSAAAAAAWATSHTYALNAVVQNGGSLFIATAGGVSASSGPGPVGTGDAIVDGTVTWAFVAVAIGGPTGTGSAIADGSVVWEFNQANVLQISASIRPMKEGRALVSDSEGEYGSEDVYVYTTTELRTRAPNNPDTESDVIQIPNTSGVLENWQIIAVKKARTYYRGTATRLVLP